MKLDKKDKRILYELDKNSRQPLSRIAKKVNLSRESVLYRIRRYFSDGIIRNYLTVINVAKLGFSHHKVYVILRNITEKEEKEFIEFLCNHPSISWVSSCDGKYSLLFAPKAKSLVELNEIIKDINNRYWKIIMEYDVASIINANHFYRDYLIGQKATTERKIEWGGEEKAIELDNVDLEILDATAKNSRVSAVDIANKLNISSDTVLNRIKQLEKSRIIEHYMIWPDVNKLCGLYYKVLVRLKEFNKEKEKMLYSYCLNNPKIVYIVNCFGQWQFEMDIEVENIKEFRELMRDFINNFSNIVSDYTALNIYEEYKFIFFEKGAFINPV